MIEKLRDKPFDVERLLADYAKACFIAGGFLNQLNVVCPENISDPKEQLIFMAGTNWDYEKNDATVDERLFSQTCEWFKGTYTESILKLLREEYTIGRVRFLVLQPKTTYSWHKDVEEIRLHIPLKTGYGAFFIWLSENPDQLNVRRMKQPGCLYSFKTTNWHTAVNADKQPRIHLVFNVLGDKN